MDFYKKAATYAPWNRKVAERYIHSPLSLIRLIRRITLIELAMHEGVLAPLLSQHTRERIESGHATGGMKRSRGLSSNLADLSRDQEDVEMESPYKRARA